MEDIIQDKQGPTLHRWETAIKDPAFNLIRKKVVFMGVTIRCDCPPVL